MCRFNSFCGSLILLLFIYSFCLDVVAEMEIYKRLEMLKWSFALIQGIIIVEKESCIVVAPLKMAEYKVTQNWRNLIRFVTMFTNSTGELIKNYFHSDQ